ncbi:AAA family ATPase [Rhizobium sp. TRM95111]|uniref:bifunctional aminoglycoside phosphotransferase/ATP-binding protein n=1 Tax=Rhizobium alarense TaxID=2846851 RepID=UPI001F2963F0|nr:bifunctional aminoglycoside phosphotransferase/ATP-binding protein [Rhizobium alarense]MCF3638756.1 AAA family ATPase [Rhizobium alarense]
MTTDDQTDAIAFLAAAATHDPGRPPEQIETHISLIALAGDRAFKMKKALKLPYVDFSTPTIREAACRREVELNGKTAPGLYLGIRRITRKTDGALEWNGQGPLVDCVVEMRRFDQNLLFDHMAQRGKLTPELMTETARMIASFHRRAPVVVTGEGAGNIAAVLDINDAGFATSHIFEAAEVDALGQKFRAKLVRHAVLLDHRARNGRLRRCHGDLHLRNICLLEGKPCLFDCIEFNDAIATVDVLYDLAFLLMDLWHRGFEDLSNLVMNRYLDVTDDEDGFCLMPFFMAIRAAVRAHVTATQAEEPGQDAARLEAEARGYFELAHVLLEGQPPVLIAIGGLSGSGKTTVADHLASRVGAPAGARVIESDRIRKALHGVSAETRLPSEAYRPAMSETVYREMACHAASILAQGGSVVADAVFDDAFNRRRIEEAAEASGAAFSGVWLDVDPPVLMARVLSRKGGPSDADQRVLAAQLARQAGGADGTMWRKLDASAPLEQVIAGILRSDGRAKRASGRSETPAQVSNT